ncbi:hypothetical protein N665_0016s0053 [Sinapis alba]|nr:hypothetical protein N665_0016s0053 [Sinapis alba]
MITRIDDLARIFLNLLILEQEKKNWVDKYLTKEDRTTVINSFKEATGYALVWNSYKNHLTNQKTWYDYYNWLFNKTRENLAAGRFHCKTLANQDLLEKVFSVSHIGTKDGWSVGNGPDVYHHQYGYNIEMQFNTRTTSQNQDANGSLPNMVNEQDDDQSSSNIDNSSSELSTVMQERSDRIKLASCEMSSVLTSDLTMASRRLHQILETEFCSSFYWDATKLISENETV